MTFLIAVFCCRITTEGGSQKFYLSSEFSKVFITNQEPSASGKTGFKEMCPSNGGVYQGLHLTHKNSIGSALVKSE